VALNGSSASPKTKPLESAWCNTSSPMSAPAALVVATKQQYMGIYWEHVVTTKKKQKTMLNNDELWKIMELN